MYNYPAYKSLECGAAWEHIYPKGPVVPAKQISVQSCQVLLLLWLIDGGDFPYTSADVEVFFRVATPIQRSTVAASCTINV